MEKDNSFDLRQDVAWNLYTDQRSETFNNAYRSALKAGYSEDHALTITATRWWKHNVTMLRDLLPLAEKVIKEDLEIPKNSSEQLRRVRADMAKFVGSTVGRNKYHTKTEIESNNIISLVEGNNLLDGLFKKKD